jgi:hypothetical protein
VRVGYVFPHDVLLAVGLTYFWGLSLALRVPIDNHFFVNFEFIQWLDAVIPNFWSVAPTLGAAYDTYDVMLGVGYRF